eukprot:TRINITY_DN11985_c0_g1_i1.p1 TRINITY_DN11985_c0_g1~~TRINITY_DN11985_c0_g1_i1.p1  ORF type:complete len:207 (+),score=38.81 TRINITY_DN11985_c0_g1_i1:117-737(+)
MPKPIVCLGLTGSVATVKVVEILEEIDKRGWGVVVVVTESAKNFLKAEYKGQVVEKGLEEKLLEMNGTLYTDDDEWSTYKKVGADDVVHIELVKRCSLLCIAPLSANSLASITHGLATNLLMSVVRAWPYNIHPSFTVPTKPFIVAPAMNPVMWAQNVTHTQIAAIQASGAILVPPVEKRVACGDVGVGGLASPVTICEAIEAALK